MPFRNAYYVISNMQFPLVSRPCLCAFFATDTFYVPYQGSIGNIGVTH